MVFSHLKNNIMKHFHFFSKKTPPQKPNWIDIKPRKLDFVLDDDTSYIWSHDKILSFCLNSVSMFLPQGELFFIDSVKYYKQYINNPILQEQLAGFIAQEALHSREHALFNRVLKKKNKNMVFIESGTRNVIKISKLFPHRTQLAITCALEHFTALFANVLLSHVVSFTKLSHPVFATLWIWHAIEETEHKAVCYDVYQYVAGGLWGYIERCFVMFIVTLSFSITIGLSILFGMMFYKKSSNTNKTIKTNNKEELLWLFNHLII